MRSGRVTLDEAVALLPAKTEGGRFAEPLTHGSMRLGLYAPRKFDPQEPHEQDELYLVVHGSGTFVHGGERTPFGPGDALFAAAGVEHRFEDFSDDFTTWVVFWGPPGGEQP
jgi:mannose-6-phosphate isomerase-like protein (cupin superfamily)